MVLGYFFESGNGFHFQFLNFHQVLEAGPDEFIFGALAFGDFGGQFHGATRWFRMSILWRLVSVA
jgi:hypothetical protein